MDRREMDQLFDQHREAERARDYDAIMATFGDDCFLETVPLARRAVGTEAVRAAYVGFFTTFPDLTPEDDGRAHGQDVVVVWGTLRGTSEGAWFGVPPSGRSFAVPFANVALCRHGRMIGESIYFDLASLCEQATLPLDQLRAAAREAAGAQAR